MFRKQRITTTAATSDDEATRFNTWLRTKRGAAVTTVHGDVEWNRAVARAAADRTAPTSTNQRGKR